MRNCRLLPSVNQGTRGSREGSITVACPGAVTSPRWMAIVAEFTARGGITTTVTAEYDGPESAAEESR